MLLHPAELVQGQEHRPRPARGDDGRGPGEPFRSGQLRGAVVDTVEGDAALEIIDRMSRKYTGEDFPMRSGVVYLIDVERSRLTELPFRDTPG